MHPLDHGSILTEDRGDQHGFLTHRYLLPGARPLPWGALDTPGRRDYGIWALKPGHTRFRMPRSIAGMPFPTLVSGSGRDLSEDHLPGIRQVSRLDRVFKHSPGLILPVGRNRGYPPRGPGVLGARPSVDERRERHIRRRGGSAIDDIPSDKVRPVQRRPQRDFPSQVTKRGKAARSAPDRGGHWGAMAPFPPGTHGNAGKRERCSDILDLCNREPPMGR